MVGMFDHHLIAAQVRSSQQLKSARHAIELQAMVLPNPEDPAFTRVVLPDTRFRIVDTGKDRIFRLDNSHEPVLIFSDAICTALFLFLLIESHYTGAETQSN